MRTNYDRELMGNLICGALGALPMTGVIVRSGANVQAGAQTRWSAVMHGGWILPTVLLIPNALEKIPTSALAAVLGLTGWKLWLVSGGYLRFYIDRSYGCRPTQSEFYLEGSETFLRLPILAATLDQVTPNAELHIHFDKLAYLNHSCLDLIQEWKQSHEDNGGKVVAEWERLVERFCRSKV